MEECQPGHRALASRGMSAGGWALVVLGVIVAAFGLQRAIDGYATWLLFAALGAGLVVYGVRHR